MESFKDFVTRGVEHWRETGERVQPQSYLLNHVEVNALIEVAEDLSYLDFTDSRFGSGDVDFSNAKFGSGTNFTNVDFTKGDVDFTDAEFGNGNVNFTNAKFGNGNVNFTNAKFGNGNVNFTNAKFGNGNVNFTNAKFGNGNIDFTNATFGNGNVNFTNAKFVDVDLGNDNVNFNNVDFGNGNIDFTNAKFGNGRVGFWQTNFGDGNVDFANANFGDGRVDFWNARFGNGNVNFTNAKFVDVDLGRVQMDFPLKIAATTIRLERSGIFQGGRVSARGRISLEGIRVAEPLSVVAGGDDAYIESMNEAWLTAPIVIGEGVDLSRCTFAGTTGLDQVRPIGRSFSKGRGRRQRLAEDPRRTLRSAKTTISESQRAERYRQLRVGLESAGNIPGANDFYYGELENRRRDAALRRPFEYLTLSAYNLSSGYGLRAWRAIAWFVVLVLAACVGFRVDGFDPEPHRATARLDGDR